MDGGRSSAMEVEKVARKAAGYYYPKCPGCRVDRKKEEHKGYPFLELFYIWVVSFCSYGKPQSASNGTLSPTSLPIQYLFPFLYFMIRDLHIAKEEEHIGFYAGFVGSSYMFGRALSSTIWGIVADKYGRKPVIIIGILSVIIFNTLFGLSSSYWMALTTRALLGLLCGIRGPIKAYATEVCRKEYNHLALALISSSRGIGLTVGSAIGGFLAQPADKYPGVFSEKSIFGRFPYFLPAYVYHYLQSPLFLLASASRKFAISICETLHKHTEDTVVQNSIEGVEKFLVDSDVEENGGVLEGHCLNLFTNWPLMSAITVYCIFSLQDVGYAETFSLWAVNDKKYGGLSFSSNDVGSVLSMSGLLLLVYQILIYPSVAKSVEPITLVRTAAILTIPIISIYPSMPALSGFILQLVVNCASFLKNAFAVTINTAFNILINDAVSQDQRASANGVCMTLLSIFKAVAPAAAGALFSWSQTRQKAAFLPGDQMVFFVLNVVTFIGILFTFRPFLVRSNVKHLY